MKQINTSRFATAFLVLAVSIPLFSQALTSTNVAQGPIRNAAVDYQPEQRELRRIYSEAIEVYRTLLKQNVLGLTKPSINDLDSMLLYTEADRLEAYVKELDPEGMHTSAPADVDAETANIILFMAEKDRQLLRWYRSVGYCPASLKQWHLEGFYELCVQLLDVPVLNDSSLQRAVRTPTPGFLNDRAYLRGVQRSTKGASNAGTLKDRIQQTLTGFHGSALRESTTQKPLRPTNPIYDSNR